MPWAACSPTPIRADRDLPPFDRSTRDGYAVQARSTHLRGLASSDRILRAGEPAPDASLAPGTALEIMTGAPVPIGADAVVMLEHVEILDGKIRFQPGRKIRPGGHHRSRWQRGPFRRFTHPRRHASQRAAHIAALAAVGAPPVNVFTKPRVAILATGDELVEIDATPQPHQIRNSNSYSLAAQVALAGQASPFASASPATISTISRALLNTAQQSCDLLLLSGGVSAGKIRSRRAGTQRARRHLPLHRGSASSPASPPSSASSRAKMPLSFPSSASPATPSPPWSPFCSSPRPCSVRSPAKPVLARASPRPPSPAAEPATDITRFLPAHLEANWDHATVTRIPWQGSGDLAATAQSNCFVVLPPDTAVEAGATVQVLLPLAGRLNTMAKKADKLSHYDKAGRARMVDVSAKPPLDAKPPPPPSSPSRRKCSRPCRKNPKGNPLEVARVAGIQAAKKTSELIPMCHPLPLTFIDVITTVTNKGVAITASAATTANTGVEMEALTAASVAALTIYDMTKALDKSITIELIQLEKKSGGKSGRYSR